MTKYRHAFAGRAAEQPRLPLELRGQEHLLALPPRLVVFILWGAVFAGSADDRRLHLRADAHLLRGDLRPAVLRRRLQRGLPDQRGHPQRPHQPVPAEADQLLRLPPERLRGGPRRVRRLRVPGARSPPCPSSGATSSFPTTAGGIALGVPAMALTAVIQFSIAYCFGLLAFWFLEIQGFVILSMAVETFLGGQFFPLDLLPPGGLQRRPLPALLLPGLLSRGHPHGPEGLRLRACRGWPSRRPGPSSWCASPRLALAARPAPPHGRGRLSPAPMNALSRYLRIWLASAPLLARAGDDVPRRPVHLGLGRAVLDLGQRPHGRA